MNIGYCKQAQKAIERLDTPEDEALPDEIAAHASAAEEYRRSEIVRDGDINWN